MHTSKKFWSFGVSPIQTTGRTCHAPNLPPVHGWPCFAEIITQISPHCTLIFFSVSPSDLIQLLPVLLSFVLSHELSLKQTFEAGIEKRMDEELEGANSGQPLSGVGIVRSGVPVEPPKGFRKLRLFKCLVVLQAFCAIAFVVLGIGSTLFSNIVGFTSNQLNR